MITSSDDATTTRRPGGVGVSRSRAWRLPLVVVLGILVALVLARRIAGTFLNAMYGA